MMVVCCLCLHATFKRPKVDGEKPKEADVAEGLAKGVAYCKPAGASMSLNPRCVRSCSKFLPAPNQVQRETALQQLGGAFTFVPRNHYVARTA